MKNKPIIIVAGEPNSIFLEIYLKSIKNNDFKKPNILIVSKSLLINQINFFQYNFTVNVIDINKLYYILFDHTITFK